MNKLLLSFSLVLISQLSLASQNVECTLSVKTANSDVPLTKKLNEKSSIILGQVENAQIQSGDTMYSAIVVPSVLVLDTQENLFVSYVELTAQNMKSGSQSTTTGSIVIRGKNSASTFSTTKTSKNRSEGIAVTCKTAP